MEGGGERLTKEFICICAQPVDKVWLRPGVGQEQREGHKRGEGWGTSAILSAITKISEKNTHKTKRCLITISCCTSTDRPFPPGVHPPLTLPCLPAFICAPCHSPGCKFHKDKSHGFLFSAEFPVSAHSRHSINSCGRNNVFEGELWEPTRNGTRWPGPVQGTRERSWNGSRTRTEAFTQQGRGRAQSTGAPTVSSSLCHRPPLKELLTPDMQV